MHFHRIIAEYFNYPEPQLKVGIDSKDLENGKFGR